MFLRIVIFSILIILCSKGYSTTFYFSTSKGSDTRSVKEAQNITTPWKSLKKLNIVAASLKPGDSILFKSDEIFYGSVSLLRSGTIKAPIYFGKYGEGKNPIWSGLTEISSWIANGENIYQAGIPSLDTNIAILIVNKELYPLGRFPNQNTKNGGYLVIQSCQNGKITSELPMSLKNYKGGEIVIRKNNWIIDRHTIISNSSNTINYETNDINITPTSQFGFFIQNHILTLDQHGEWYFDLEKKKLFLYYNGDPKKAEIRIASQNEILNIHNSASNLIFENISFEGSNDNLINISGSSNITLEKCKLEFIGKNAINSRFSKNLFLSNSTIKNSLNGGVFLGWQDQGIILQKNSFENIFNFPGMGQNGEMQGQPIYMSETSSSGLIENNKFIKSGYNAINFNGNNITIKNNYIDTFCFIKDDGAGIYTFTGPLKNLYVNRKIIGNIIINGIGADNGTKKNNPSDLPPVEGIYLDENASGVKIEGNTIINVKSKGIFLNHARNSIISNNKIINTGYSIYIANDKQSGSVENIEVTNNQLVALKEGQLHYFIRSSSADLSLMGKFHNNFFINPKNSTQTIYLQTPTITEQITLTKFQEKYNLDRDSVLGINDYLNNSRNGDFYSHDENSLFFDYNLSNSAKNIPLTGTYIDLQGKKVVGEINIPPYSTIILFKIKSNQ